MIDIRLRDVQVLWDYRGQEPDAPSLLVMGHPDESGKDQYGNQDDPDYHSAWGTRSADLVGLSDEEWTSKLFEQFHSLVCFEGLVPRIVHEAFCVIPEYRVCLIWRGRASHIPPDLRDKASEQAVMDRLQRSDAGSHFGGPPAS